jgi:hypothetical protein
MTSSLVRNWEIAKLEYEQELTQYQNCTVLRRQDMAFVTTAQGAVLAIISSKLLVLDLASFLLSLIACFLLILGFNSERRLSSYMKAYSEKARQVEDELGLSLIKTGFSEIRNKRLLFSNSVLFHVYYPLLIFGWVVVWVSNVIKWKSIIK